MWKSLAAAAGVAAAGYLLHKGVVGAGSGVSPGKSGPVGTGTILIPKGLLKINLAAIPRDFWSGIILRTVPLSRLAMWSLECGRDKWIKPFWGSRDNTTSGGSGNSVLPLAWDTEQRKGPSVWAPSSEVSAARSAKKNWRALKFFELYGRSKEPFRAAALGYGGDKYMQSLLAAYVVAQTKISGHYHSAMIDPPFFDRTDLWGGIVDAIADIPLIGDLLTTTYETGGTHGRWAAWGDDLGLLVFPPARWQSPAHYKAWLAHQLHFFNGSTHIWKHSWRYTSRYSDVPAADTLIKSTGAQGQPKYIAGNAKSFDEDPTAMPGVVWYNWIQLCACLSFHGLIEAGGNLTMGWAYEDPWGSWVQSVGGKKPKEMRKPMGIGSAAAKMLVTGMGTGLQAMSGNYAGAFATFAAGAAGSMASIGKSYSAAKNSWWHDDWTPVLYDAAKLGSGALLQQPSFARSDEINSHAVERAITQVTQAATRQQIEMSLRNPTVVAALKAIDLTPDVYVVQGYG